MSMLEFVMGHRDPQKKSFLFFSYRSSKSHLLHLLPSRSVVTVFYTEYDNDLRNDNAAFFQLADRGRHQWFKSKLLFDEQKTISNSFSISIKRCLYRQHGGVTVVWI